MWTCIMIEISYCLPINASRSSFSSLDLRGVFQYLSWVVLLLNVISLYHASLVVRHLRPRFVPCGLIYSYPSIASQVGRFSPVRLDARSWAGDTTITSRSLMLCLFTKNLLFCPVSPSVCRGTRQGLVRVVRFSRSVARSFLRLSSGVGWEIYI